MEMMLANNGNKQEAILLLVTVVYYTCTHGTLVASKIKTELIITVLDLLQLQQTFNFW